MVTPWKPLGTFPCTLSLGFVFSKALKKALSSTSHLEMFCFQFRDAGQSVAGGLCLSEVWRLIASLVGVLSCESWAAFSKQQPFLYTY